MIALGAFQNDLCFFCDEPLIYLDPRARYRAGEANHPLQASFDHFVSRRQGGGGTKENTVIAHRDCNSRKGHEDRSDEYDEKLRLLNIHRGFGDENGQVEPDAIRRRLRPDEFGCESPALLYLCDLANALEGEEGRILRCILTKRMQDHTTLLSKLSVIENLGFRREILHALRNKREAERIPLEKPFDTLLANVLAMMTRQHFQKAEALRSRKKAKRAKDACEGRSNRFGETESDPNMTEEFSRAKYDGDREERADEELG